MEEENEKGRKMNDELNIYDPIDYYRIQLNNNVQEEEVQQTKFNKYDIFILILFLLTGLLK